MENTLLDKLNEWAGTTDVEYTHKKFGIAYCFEYIVPKLGFVDLTFCKCDDGTWEFVLDMGGVHYLEVDKTPALALCRAVAKLIEEENATTK